MILLGDNKRGRGVGTQSGSGGWRHTVINMSFSVQYKMMIMIVVWSVDTWLFSSTPIFNPSSLISILFTKNVSQKRCLLAVKISNCASLSASPSAQCLNCFDRKVKGECNYVNLEELRWAHQEIIGRVPVEAGSSLWDSGPFKITQVTWGHAWWLKICGATNMGHQKGIEMLVSQTTEEDFFMAWKSRRGGFKMLYTWGYMW